MIGARDKETQTGRNGWNMMTWQDKKMGERWVSKRKIRRNTIESERKPREEGLSFYVPLVEPMSHTDGEI